MNIYPLLHLLAFLPFVDGPQKDEMQDDDEDSDDVDEENVTVPSWMVPYIKENIIKIELSFMLNRPSDDSNNATLASVKPHGPQDDEE